MAKQDPCFNHGITGLDDIIGVQWDSSDPSPTLKRIDEDLEELPNTNWSIEQVNIDGAVIGPTSAYLILQTFHQLS